MEAAARAARGAKIRTQMGWTLTGLVSVFLAFSFGVKLAGLGVVAETFERLGWQGSSGRWVGALELACTLLYVVPRTSVLGAVLLTGLLGGAIATHARIADPLFSHTLFGVYMGVLVWGGLYLRDERVRALLPLRRRGAAGRRDGWISL